MILKTKLFGKVYQFTSVKEVLAKANEEKSGDKLAGVAANSAEERVAAKVVLSELSLNDLFNNPVVDYDEDEVTRIIIDQVSHLSGGKHQVPSARYCRLSARLALRAPTPSPQKPGPLHEQTCFP